MKVTVVRVKCADSGEPELFFEVCKDKNIANKLLAKWCREDTTDIDFSDKDEMAIAQYFARVKEEWPELEEVEVVE